MKVVKKQLNTHDCIICGMDNPAGLKAPFYEMEDGSVVSKFIYQDIHQSYPGRAHGGMITCMLDELVGRAIWTIEPLTWGVTASISVRFHKPVPLNQELMAIGKVVKNNRFIFDAEGVIKDKNGTVLASAKATYFKLKPEQIMDDPTHNVMFLVEDDVKEVDVF